ncbi:hypothetical protein EDB85DRAFT_2150333 [Lactarius pseudohatsudake]|nr:hypothetical protein EDB85DRAFT_2150333 [Lactarius pseudohatsudake]
MPAHITLTAEGLRLIKKNLEKACAIRRMKENLEKACRRYRADGHSGGRYKLSTPSSTYPPISMTSRVRMPPAEARERYEDMIYDAYGCPMEYDAWGRPSEDMGNDWYGTPVIWDYNRECWCLDEGSYALPAEAREEYEAYSEDWADAAAQRSSAWYPNHDADEDAPTATGTPSTRAARPPNHGGDGYAMEKRRWDVSRGDNNAMARQRGDGDVWGDWVAKFQVALRPKKTQKV